MNLLKIIVLFFLFYSASLQGQERFPNGQLKYEGDRQHGVYIEYYENGNIHRRWDRRSAVQFLCYYEGFENGQAKDSTFINDDSTYSSYQFYENGQVKQKGVRVAKFKVDDDGDTTSVSGLSDGLWTFYSPNGDSTAVLYEEGEIVGSGPVRMYYFNGQVEKSTAYVNGKQQGYLMKYFPSGQLKYKCNYQEGKADGKCFSYYENGQLERQENYVRGKKRGQSNWYFTDGTLEYTYYHNRKGEVTKYFWYRPDGSLKERTINKGDSRSTSYYYNKEGKLTAIHKILDPKLWIEIKYDENGTKIKEERHQY